MKSKQHFNFANPIDSINEVTEQVQRESVQTNQAKVKALYTAEDIIDLPHLNSLPGNAPFLRGPYKTMYTEKPWTIRQYAGFADADETNKLFREALAQGSQGLSVAFDLPTHRGYDSDHPLASADVGMAGVAIDSVEDMKRLMADIPLDKISVSMTMSGAVLPIIAAFIVAAEESGVPANLLSGTIQNDIIKEFMVRNTYIYAPQPSMRIATDVVEYIAKNMPRFNGMSISGYHFQEAGADSALELALTLANGRAYVMEAQQRGLDIDKFCSQVSFFFGVGSDFYTEIAKLRAARVLWCEIVENLGATIDKAKALRMHCQTSGWSLTAQDPMNNIARTTLQAMAAVFGGTQSLHTNAYDEAVSLPTNMTSRLARNTQLIIQAETGICDVIDPWAGSYMMESLTGEMVENVKSIMAEIEQQGGVIAALESGWVNTKIQSNSALVQANIENCKRVIVGLNKHVSSDNQVDHEYLEIDSKKIKDQQVAYLSHLKLYRDQLAVRRALNAITETAMKNNGNLLEVTIQAIKVRATVGECISALEKVWSRYSSNTLPFNDVFSQEMQDTNDWLESCQQVKQLSLKLGRKPSLLITKLGQDGHDRGINIIATSLHDAGFEVHQAPLFQTPEQVARRTIILNVDIVGVSTLAGAHLTLLPILIDNINLLKKEKTKTKKIHIVAGGVIPQIHFKELKTLGVNAIFCPGEKITNIINQLVLMFF